jgi:hypothetical protein
LEVALNVLFDGVFLAGESRVAFACELMFDGILAGDLLTCVGGGPRGQFGVCLICRDLSWRGHLRFLLFVSKVKELPGARFA